MVAVWSTGMVHVRATSPADCKADLAGYCKAGAQVQSQVSYYSFPAGGSRTPPAKPFVNCSAFGCTCKGKHSAAALGQPA